MKILSYKKKEEYGYFNLEKEQEVELEDLDIYSFSDVNDEVYFELETCELSALKNKIKNLLFSKATIELC